MAETSAPQDEGPLQYWGYLFKEDKCGTDLLLRLLAGIANFIRTTFEPTDSPDLTPSQLALFYRAVGGNYDTLFLETPPNSIAFIYKSLGCLHSLQPSPTDDGYGTPCIPALKTKGFITWQTIQLLLGPEEQVPFLQAAVHLFDILDPATGTPFPKTLPREAFPDKPDPAMTQWYESVSDRLRQEAQASSSSPSNSSTTEPRNHRHHHHRHTARSSSPSHDSTGASDRRGAAQYFANPLYRDRDGRPGVVRRTSRRPRSRDRERDRDDGYIQARIGGVRHLYGPAYGHGSGSRRSSLPEQQRRAEGGSDAPALAAAALKPRYGGSRRGSHQRERERERERRDSATESEPEDAERQRWPPRGGWEDGGRERERERDRALRHRKSASPSRSPRMDTPAQQYAHGRRLSVQPAQLQRAGSSASASPSPVAASRAGYGPSEAPIFAAHVAHLSPPRERAAVLAGQGAARGLMGGVRYMNGEGRRGDGGDGRGRDREMEMGMERGGGREVEGGQIHRYVSAPPQVNGVGGRRYPVEASWR